MSFNMHNAIKNEYEKRQKAAYDRLVDKQDKVFESIPGLADIDNRIKILGIKCNKTILMGNDPCGQHVEDMLSRIDALKNEKVRLLTQNGYPANYLEPDYQCPKCNDTGFVESENGHVKCACYKQQVLNYLYNQANLKLVETENFDFFNENFYSREINEKKYGIGNSPYENIMHIKRDCLAFIDNFNSPDEKNLFFTGSTGTGKTFMANCIARELINKGVTVLYLTAPMLFNAINEYKAKAFKDEEFENDSYNNILNTELLIIDDLGTESPSASKYAELLTVLNTRQINDRVKPCKTIISTNINMKKLREYYDERIISRIMGCFNIFLFAGEDIRRIKLLTNS